MNVITSIASLCVIKKYKGAYLFFKKKTMKTKKLINNYLSKEL